MKTTIGVALLLLLAGCGFGQTGDAPDSAVNNDDESRHEATQYESPQNNMVYIEGGTFTMGSPRDEPGRWDNERQHQVTVSSFYMGKYEVTQKEYQEVMGLLPKYIEDDKGKGDDYPVYSVGWYDALMYCNARSQREGLAPVYTINGTIWDRNANGYRLPTEAEWEYACRAGTTTPWYYGETSDNLGDYAWYGANSGGTTHPVGQKSANAYGLYDMYGNVSEFCWDLNGRYPDEAQVNPLGPPFPGRFRITRGGDWFSKARYTPRSAFREDLEHSLKGAHWGFRVARNSDEGVTVSFDHIHFQADTAIMLPGEREKLDKIIDILRGSQERTILVSGHTALAGTAGGRKQLSAERAAVVADYIIAQNARTPDRVTVRGYGADKPLGDNSTPEGKRKNRRVEITILED